MPKILTTSINYVSLCNFVRIATVLTCRIPFMLLVLRKYCKVLLEAVSQGTLPLKECSMNTRIFPRRKSSQNLPNASFSSSLKSLL